MPIFGTTRVYGIIGWPVAHSLSPAMQNAAFQALGLDCCYVPFAVAPEHLAAAVNGLRCLDVRGFNVTIPHKEAVIPLLDALSDEAQRAGAVNVVKSEDGRLIGHNTDGSGFIRSLTEDLHFDPRGKRVLLLGAGGAGRAALAALCAAGAAAVTVVNRSRQRAETLVALFAGSVRSSLATAPLTLLGERSVADFDLLVNSTSIGMQGTSFAGFNPALLNPGACVYDMVYAPAETPLLAAVRRAEIRGANGLGMLAGQGELAFRFWTGHEPPPGLMKQTLLTLVGS
jgi:shikimate dehydrogenase